MVMRGVAVVVVMDHSCSMDLDEVLEIWPAGDGISLNFR